MCAWTFLDDAMSCLNVNEWMRKIEKRSDQVDNHDVVLCPLYIVPVLVRMPVGVGVGVCVGVYVLVLVNYVICDRSAGSSKEEQKSQELPFWIYDVPYCRIPSTEYRVQSTEYTVQSTEYTVPGCDRHAHHPCHPCHPCYPCQPCHPCHPYHPCHQRIARFIFPTHPCMNPIARV